MYNHQLHPGLQRQMRVKKPVTSAKTADTNILLRLETEEKLPKKMSRLRTHKLDRELAAQDI